MDLEIGIKMNKDIFLSNRFRKFKRLSQWIKKVGMYVCGPTVYDDPHIEQATLVVFDLLFKVLKCKYGNKSSNICKKYYRY